MKRALALVALVGVIAVAAVAGRADASSTRSSDVSITRSRELVRLPARLRVDPAARDRRTATTSPTPRSARVPASPRSRRAPSTSARPTHRCRPTSSRPARVASQIPWALSATSILYNLPGINCVLHLTGPMLAQIYLGQITSWNDATIKAINSKCNLPGTKITPVYRSDNSGTTYNFTDYLSTVSADWKSKLGVGVNAQWPTGVGGSGSSGVSGVVTKTEGAIGYADVAYALKNKLRFASDPEQGSGKYATPGLRGINAAAATLPKKITGNGAALDRRPAEGQSARVPDLHVHVRDRADRLVEGGRAAEARSTGPSRRARSSGRSCSSSRCRSRCRRSTSSRSRRSPASVQA